MVRTQIQLTEKQAKAVKKMASAQGVSVAELIRRAVDNIVNSSTTADTEERKRRALDIVGKFRSGKKDVSKEHDVHLAEAYE